MVATQNKEVLGVLYLVGEQQANGLERLLATVHVVSEKEVVCFWGKAAVLEEAQEVIVLSVDVATDLEMCGEFDASEPDRLGH